MRRLRLLCGRVEAHVRALIPLFMEKLPLNMRLIISRAVDQPKWDLAVLLNAFDNEIARERCEPIGTNPTNLPTSKKPFSVPSRKGKGFSYASALINQSEESVTCTFCKRGHPSASCGVVTDIEAGRNLLKREGRCFICLRRNHLARKTAFAQKDITCKFS